MLGTEDLGPVVAPEFVKRLSHERTPVNDTLSLGAVNHLPEFPDHGTMGEGFAQDGLEAAPSPDAFHGERFKDQG